MTRFLSVTAFLLLVAFGNAQGFTVGFKISQREAVVLAAAQVATGQVGDFRISPVVQAEMRTNYTTINGYAMGGVEVVYLPPDNVLTIIATALYRHVWGAGHSGPEFTITIVF